VSPGLLARIAGALVVAVLALAVGMASLHHPIAGWLPSLARKSDVPPVIGAGLLVVPVVVVGVLAWRLREAVGLAVEARRQRRRRRE
jgi:hypothetical protein